MAALDRYQQLPTRTNYSPHRPHCNIINEVIRNGRPRRIRHLDWADGWSVSLQSQPPIDWTELADRWLISAPGVDHMVLGDNLHAETIATNIGTYKIHPTSSMRHLAHFMSYAVHLFHTIIS